MLKHEPTKKDDSISGERECGRQGKPTIVLVVYSTTCKGKHARNSRPRLTAKLKKIPWHTEKRRFRNRARGARKKIPFRILGNATENCESRYQTTQTYIIPTKPIVVSKIKKYYYIISSIIFSPVNKHHIIIHSYGENQHRKFVFHSIFKAYSPSPESFLTFCF